MAPDQGLVARVRAAITDQALEHRLALREKHMFGGFAFMLDDKMACGVINDDLMVRVGPAAHDDALAHEHARPMDFTGKPMRGYVFVGARGCDTQASVAYWVDRAAANVESLIRAERGSGERG